ncbi:MAG TPA: hypothetical protein VD835_07435 [Pyrinomonadaceae bacterium]|nr:hypothetical protein [Pyrinomonadaceae bacterium]
MKEAIQKDIAERTDKRKEQNFSTVTKKVPESRGFTAKPEKKRG